MSNRQIVWEDYKRLHPDGYERSQFFFHLAQNLKAQKSPTSVLHHEPGPELYVDFAGGTCGTTLPLHRIFSLVLAQNRCRSKFDKTDPS